ncbi:hypothetical protein EJF36_16345 [Bacillus sp. HMF5848]|uniref:hypothetical protein n=1 Tax=Bacillus sp. HMF5848 TaxID=2495421 RepID=UPI000F77F1BD|nr:hypothetical protein [Bacillus sp. HMF5848]RSK28304.1 hypothetical protein EJF36_16345 [Bacillus sp. HMF5848]
MSFEKSYRYEILLQAIEIFTQRYDKDTLLKFSFEFANELLTLHKAALFEKEGSQYYLVHNRLYNYESYEVQSSQALDKLPLYYGRVLSPNQLLKYFPMNFIEDFSAAYVIPLINDTDMIGFIVTNGKSVGEMSADDNLLIDILMRLVNSSIENNQRFLDYQTLHHQLDQKIYNLFVLNQSIKALLSELNPRELYKIATEVFSEISGSFITSFGLYSDTINTIQVKGYRNVFSFEKKYFQLQLKETFLLPNKIYLHIEDDKEELMQIFEDITLLSELETEYVIFIQKNNLIGVVTLSKSHQGNNYDSGLFELIETLASSTYIALNNAFSFEKIEKQKIEAEAKFHVLQTYNRLIRNINSCRTLDELFTLALHTLALGFGVEKAFFILQQDETYLMKKNIGFEASQHQVHLNEAVTQNIDDEIFYDYFSENLSSYFNDDHFISSLGDTNSIIFAPIQIKNYYEREDEESNPYGYLVVTKTKSIIKQEDLLLIDTITRNITPLIFHLENKL